MTSETQLDAMREQIFSSPKKAQAQRDTLRRNNARYMTVTIILAALAALLANMAETIARSARYANGNAQNWKITCLFAAVCSVGVTVTAKLQTAEQLTKASECVEQKALRFETMIPTYDLQQVSAKHQQILSEYFAINV